jgi:putative multiple sugar transport system permease protein
MQIFRGALLRVTSGTGTIIVPNDAFNAIGNGYIPEILSINGFHGLTLILGVLAIVLYIWAEVNKRRNKLKYNFEVLSSTMFCIKLLFISIVIAYITWILAGYNGLSWTVVVVIIVVLIFNFIANKTVLGRHIYAVGGNPDAAKLSGINVNRVSLIVFSSMSMLAALAGILFTARLQSATTTAGVGFELDAIAAAFVGGVSAAGGVGKVTGSIIGAFLIASLTNGMNLMGVDISYQYIIKGAVLVAAVVFDVKARNNRA